MDKRMTIFYFSATGNSLHAARAIAARHDNSAVIPMKAGAEKDCFESDIVGFVFPVYVGILPRTVKDFLSSFPIRQDTYYFCVTTFYTYRGIALGLTDKILREKGAALDYGNAVSTVGNCLMEYEVPEKRRAPKLLKADRKLAAIADDIANRVQRCGFFSFGEKIHAKLFRLVFEGIDKKFRTNDRCTGCGICTQICQRNNIVLEEGRPLWKGNCEACHACVHGCPRNALHVGKSEGRLQYRHPQVELKDLLKRT